jgi:hypothetical protein
LPLEKGMKKNNRLIVVIGVHRSGTSAITKGLETMGVSLGNTFIPPNIFNEKGYWEDSDFHALNLEILDKFENRLRRILSIDDEEAAFFLRTGYQKEASELLFNKLSKNHLLGIKDPRFSLLLPFWRTVFKQCDIDVSFVIALRNPLDVTACQEQFKNQHHEKSLWIWISYLLSCIENSQGTERIIVDYDELLKKPIHQMERLSQVLQLPLLPEILKSYSYDFIDSSLRHFHGKKEHSTQHSFCSSFALEMYEQLYAVATDRKDFQELEKFLPKWKTQFSYVKGLLECDEINNHRIYQLMESNQNLHQTNTEQLKTIIDLNKTIMEKFNFVAELHQTIEQSNRQIAFITQQQKNSL